MPRYKNLNGNSGIAAYEIEDDFIIVQFCDGTIHLYSNSSAGIDHIKEMKRLAAEGRGLNTFIETVLKDKYSSKLR